MLILSGVHMAAHFVRSPPELLFKSEIAAVRILFGYILLLSGHLLARRYCTIILQKDIAIIIVFADRFTLLFE